MECLDETAKLTSNNNCTELMLMLVYLFLSVYNTKLYTVVRLL